MRRFTPEQVATAFELQQMLWDLVAELDLNDARDVSRFYTQDGVFVTAGGNIEGNEAIQAYYDNRNRRVAELMKDGYRTGRHVFGNVRVTFDDEHHATLHFTNVNYAGEGRPPVSGLKGPSVLADCRMDCVRQSDGSWLFSRFHPDPALIGEDEFIKKMMAQAEKK